MHETSVLMVSLGVFLLVGLVTEFLGKKTALPGVTLLILFGILVGPSFLNIIPQTFQDAFPFLTNIALAMVGFLVGGKLEWKKLQDYGKGVAFISIAVTLITAVLVFTGIRLVDASLILALLLGGVSCATDPASTMDVVREGKAKGRFTDTLVGIVAVDDVWALVIFSFLLVVAKELAGQASGEIFLNHAAREIIGSVLLGVAVGVPAAYLTGRLEAGEPTLMEALGVVFLAGGLAIWMELSYILCCVTLGFVLVNLAKHHERPFHEIENIETPFLTLFFVLSGASMDIWKMTEIPWLLGSFFVARILGRVCGGWAGSVASGSDPAIRKWIGIALLPQAGVTLGMALYASQRFPGLSDNLLPTVLGSTVIFEVLGPILTKHALVKAGEYNG